MSESMGCPHCGGAMQITSEFRGRVVRCPHCSKDLTIPATDVSPVGAPPVAGVAPPPASPVQSGSVPTYLVRSILTTLFCCMPFGIVAIVFAAQVQGQLATGNIAAALECSRKARTWSRVSFICGIIPIILIVLFYAVMLICFLTVTRHVPLGQGTPTTF